MKTIQRAGRALLIAGVLATAIALPAAAQQADDGDQFYPVEEPEQEQPVEVLPEVIERPDPAPEPEGPVQVLPETLPRTGTDSAAALALGLGLVAGGSGAVALSRRRAR